MAKSEDKYEETKQFIENNWNDILKEGLDCSYKYKQKKQRNKKARAEYGELEEKVIKKLIDICKWNTAKNLMDLASKIMVCLEYEIYSVIENCLKQRIENIKKNITNSHEEESDHSESVNDEDDNTKITDINVNNTNPPLNEKEEKEEKQFTFLTNNSELIENVKKLLECKLMQVKSILNMVQTEKQENKSSKIDNSNNTSKFENVVPCDSTILLKPGSMSFKRVDSQNEQRQHSFGNNEQPMSRTTPLQPLQSLQSSPIIQPLQSLQSSPIIQPLQSPNNSILLYYSPTSCPHPPPPIPSLTNQPSLSFGMIIPPQSPNNTRKRSSPSSSSTTDLSYSPNFGNESSISLSPCSPHPEMFSPSSSKSPGFKRTYH